MSVSVLRTPATPNELQQKINEIISQLGAAYTLTFNSTTDWTSASDEDYSLTVSASTHGLGTDLCVDVWTLNGENYEKFYGYPSDGYTVTMSSGGDITITTGTPFAGKVVIK